MNKYLLIATSLATVFVALFLLVPDIIADSNIKDYTLAGPATTTSTPLPTPPPTPPPTTTGSSTTTTSSTPPPTTTTTTASTTASSSTSTIPWTSSTSSTSTYFFGDDTGGGGDVIFGDDTFVADDVVGGGGGGGDDVACVGPNCIGDDSGGDDVFADDTTNTVIDDSNLAEQRSSQGPLVCLDLLSCDSPFMQNLCACGDDGKKADPNAALYIYDINATVLPDDNNPNKYTNITVTFRTNKPAAVNVRYQKGIEYDSGNRSYDTKPNNREDTYHVAVIGSRPDAQIYNFTINARTQDEKAQSEPFTVKTLRPYDDLWSLVLKILFSWFR